MAMPTVEPEVIASVHDLVSKVIDNVDTSKYVGVRIRDEQGAQVPVGQDDVMDMMNAELAAVQAQLATAQQQLAAANQEIQRLVLTCSGRPALLPL